MTSIAAAMGAGLSSIGKQTFDFVALRQKGSQELAALRERSRLDEEAWKKRHAARQAAQGERDERLHGYGLERGEAEHADRLELEGVRDENATGRIELQDRLGRERDAQKPEYMTSADGGLSVIRGDEASPVTMAPRGGLIAGAMGHGERVPFRPHTPRKPSAASTKYSELVELGVPQEIARGLSYGSHREFKDAMTGETTVVDVATNQVVGTLRFDPSGGARWVAGDRTTQAPDEGRAVQATHQPPQEAIDQLRRDDSPKMREFFDQVFGAGAAERALGPADGRPLPDRKLPRRELPEAGVREASLPGAVDRLEAIEAKVSGGQFASFRLPRDEALQARQFLRDAVNSGALVGADLERAKRILALLPPDGGGTSIAETMRGAARAATGAVGSGGDTPDLSPGRKAQGRR